MTKTEGAAALLSVATLVALAAPVLDAAAGATELAGATLPDTLRAGEKTLKLNGLGLRKKAVFKVYVGGIYLESPTRSSRSGSAASRHPRTSRRGCWAGAAFGEAIANAPDETTRPSG